MSFKMELRFKPTKCEVKIIMKNKLLFFEVQI